MNDLLASLAPTLASAILGPLGGVAVAALGKVFGIDGATTEQVSKVFQDGRMTPEQLSAIKALELKYQADEKERGFRYAELTFKDSADARFMQVATRSNVPAALAALVTTGFFGILIFMIVKSDYKPTEPLLVLLGALSTSWTMIVGFYFGSSHGSQAKSELLASK
jgi:hypothetical protein